MIKLKGYSLIEIMVAMGVFAVVMALGTNIIATSVRNSAKSEGLNEVRQDVDNVLDVMSRTIKNARTVDNCVPNFGPHDSYVSLSVDSQYDDSFICKYVTGPEPTYIVTRVGKPISSDNIVISECQISCTPATAPYSKVSIDITASSKNTAPGEQANYSTSLDITIKNPQ